MHINKRKEELSKAYLNIICASAGISFESQVHDEDSKDVILKKRLFNPSYYSNIAVQLKATSQEIVDSMEIIKYDLNKKNYDDLRARGSMKTYLFLLVVPDVENEWIDQDLHRLIIRGCMYYLDLTELEESDNLSSVRVSIPKSNIVSIDSIINLLYRERDGE